MQICSSCYRKRNESEATHDTKNVSSHIDIPSEERLHTRFYCCGRVPPEGPYRKRHGMGDKNEFNKEDSFEVGVEALENSNLGITKTINPKVPFIENLPEELYQGRAIEVHGRLSENATKFSINLSTGKDNSSDLALHLNPRFDRHVIVRNHRIKNKWGVEEIASLQPFPFQIKRSFSILIFVADEQFLIAVNKIHFCAFSFRIPVDKIKSLIILGDIILTYIQHYDRTSYPPQIFKRTPFIIIPIISNKEVFKCNFRRKIRSIKEGSKIDIFGRLKVLPRAFYVNLQKGIEIWPHPIIPFHMNYRLHQPGTHKNEREIIFNSWSNGLWGKEQIITFCPFLPGTPFHIKLLCISNGYHVFVNDKYLFNYSKKEDVDVDSVVIHGDVVVSKVMLH